MPLAEIVVPVVSPPMATIPVRIVPTTVTMIDSSVGAGSAMDATELKELAQWLGSH